MFHAGKPSDTMWNVSLSTLSFINHAEMKCLRVRRVTLISRWYPTMVVPSPYGDTVGLIAVILGSRCQPWVSTTPLTTQFVFSCHWSSLVLNYVPVSVLREISIVCLAKGSKSSISRSFARSISFLEFSRHWNGGSKHGGVVSRRPRCVNIPLDLPLSWL